MTYDISESMIRDLIRTIKQKAFTEGHYPDYSWYRSLVQSVFDRSRSLFERYGEAKSALSFVESDVCPAICLSDPEGDWE